MLGDVVVFLHGRGLAPDSVSLVASAFPEADLLAPLGGVELRRGRTWFQNREIGVAEPTSVHTAETHFFKWFEEQAIGGQKGWLCGFSNGGAFAGHLLLDHPHRFAGAALLSAPLVLPLWLKGGLTGKAVFYGHGDSTDTVVSQNFFEAAEEYLSGESGCTVTLHQYTVGHVVSDEMVRDLGAWFKAARVTLSSCAQEKVQAPE